MNQYEKESNAKHRNNENVAFKKSRKKQAERDQLVMPIDELPLEEINHEAKEERNKKKTKKDSSSE
ncbi:hypothetical protein ACFFHM_09855 [Halalkalibacter kiskunsagensis]|uniref:Uncharacterized protein n=1 Tax=Halalkalibacter kiskunsagensis TaxID=1548599 RepID=A0ABV6KBV1_9BACI